jgi:TetR/AcrR family tetracycline transcriptional repressor
MMIETGLRLLGEVGLDGLTVRRLAAELGVQSPALYWHIRTKQDLLNGMADEIIRAAGMGPPHDGETWQDWLTRRARAYRASLLAHRDGARVVAGARQLSPVTLRLFDQELTAMVGCGFTPLLGLRTITALTAYVNGSVLREQARGQESAQPPHDPPPVPTDGCADGPDGAVEGGPSEMLLAAVRELGSSGGEQVFEHGLRAIIDGTAAALDRERPSADR